MKKIKQFFKANGKGLFLVLRYGLAKVAGWQSQAIYDTLTGLYNRRFLQETGKKELTRAVRYGRCFSLIQIDIDDFKRINDEEGHLAGDEVLKRVATFLEETCRQSDIISRIGGDEFLILLPETSKEEAEKVVERTKSLSKEKLFSPQGRPIGLSCGLASWEEKLSLESLRQKADLKMYQAKNAERRQR